MLRPVWRGLPGLTGVGAIALDPDEAAWVLEHGCTLDGRPYTASTEGFTGRPDRDGRIAVRITPVDLVERDWRESSQAA